MGLILPVVLLLFGTGGGITAALLLKPKDEPLVAEMMENPCGPIAEGSRGEQVGGVTPDQQEDSEGREYARLNNQFIVPIVSDNRVSGLVVMSISIEVPNGQTSVVFEHEPKLRDGFLQVLFDHANLGGFDGQFTSGPNMRVLRSGLLQAAQGTIGSIVSDVLILDLVKQEV